MVLDQAPDDMRFIKMHSHNNSNLSLVPVFNEDEIVDNNFKRYSFTSGELYDERTQITVLLGKMVNTDGRYAKYHPNVMLALLSSHCMLDASARQSSQGSGEGLEESKSEECNVFANCKPTPAELDMIRSGAVSSEQLREYANTHKNRQPFANPVSAPAQDAHYQQMVDDAIAASHDCGDLQALDSHLEQIRIYEANVLEAEYRSLQDMQFESGDFDDKPGGDSSVHPDSSPNEDDGDTSPPSSHSGVEQTAKWSFPVKRFILISSFRMTLL